MRETLPALDPGALVSVIVINHNGAQHLRECLPSLTEQSYPALEVLVVDNGSTDDSENVAAQFPVRWEALGRNVGFALGNNMGAHRARGAVLVFVNNDMRFPADFIERLVAPLTADPHVFSTDARQLSWGGDRELHLATRLARTPGRRPWPALRGILPGFDFEQCSVVEATDVLFSSAANLAARRWMFEELGGFDHRYPIGWEDTDICWRAWMRSWKSVFVPDAYCWHHVSMSAVSEAGAFFRFRGSLGGRLLFAAKLMPGSAACLIWVIALAAALRHLVLWRPKEAMKRLRVVAEFLRLLPVVIPERVRLYARARTTPRRHLARLQRLGRRDFD
jgi:GT2 family glycosyltransferase